MACEAVADSEPSSLLLWPPRLVLKNRLSEYVRLAERGERVLVTDRDRVVAELGPPQAGTPEMGDVLERARLPFPAPVRTLDALHLASLHFLREQGQDMQLASYDERIRTVARRMKIELYEG